MIESLEILTNLPPHAVLEFTNQYGGADVDYRGNVHSDALEWVFSRGPIYLIGYSVQFSRSGVTKDDRDVPSGWSRS